MSDTNKNVDLGKKDELIKKESAFVDLLSMEINKKIVGQKTMIERLLICLLYTSPSPRDLLKSRMPSSA